MKEKQSCWFGGAMLLLLTAVMWFGCGDDGAANEDGGDVDSDSDGDSDVDSDSDGDSDSDSDSDSDLDLDIDHDCPEDIDDLGITEVPDDFQAYINAGCTKYTEVVAPNGKPIRLFAQDRITDEMLVRARNVLEFYLENIPGSEYGEDKSSVANYMSDSNACLLLLNGYDGEYGEVNLPCQWLFEDEITPEGSDWYMQNQYDEHRDATFEEILHLVHDSGIGVYADLALPDFQSEILAAQQNALNGSPQLWGLGDVEDWIEELSQEGSLTQEYLAAVVDSYYGLWGAWDGQDGAGSGGGMWGIYIAKTRQDIENEDPMGWDLMDGKFFNPWLTYNARVSAELDGDFSMTFDETVSYTHKSQYLLNVTLTGENDANLIGNDQDNTLRGNEGDNELDGKGGYDTAVFKGAEDEYEVVVSGSVVTVTDSVSGRDGEDVLVNIERLRFCGQ